MSTDIFELAGVMVTRLVGPQRSDGGDRIAYQITTDQGYLVLPADQAVAIAKAILTDQLEARS